MALQLPGLPVEEQMVDNWGQPTPFMQLRWQEMAEKLVAQEAGQDQVLFDLGAAQSALASQAATLATTVSGLSAVVSNVASITLLMTDLDVDVGLALVDLQNQITALGVRVTNCENRLTAAGH